MEERKLIIKSQAPRSNAAASMPNRLDLAQVSWLRPLLESRWPLFLARGLTLAGFVFTILIGFWGTPVGSHNFAIIFVWIAWWSALKLVFIPLGGRSWCSVCPLPMPGEWLMQGGLLSKAHRRFGLGLRWPKKLGGYWIQAGLFLVIGLFSAVTLTDARVTAAVLLGLILLAVFSSFIFEQRAFCSHMCPIGGFTGIYASTAPIELRVRDSAVCASHTEKTCYHECPWGVYPLALKDNAACGLCMECLRVCPRDNIALNLRPFGSDLMASGQKHRLDEVFMALVMMGSVLIFAAVFTGPWGNLKNAAFNIFSLPWFGYVLGCLLLNLLVLPTIFAFAVHVQQKFSRRNINLPKAMAEQVPILVSLGLFAWIAFTISFALPKMDYVLNVLSDPLGLGWNLLGQLSQSVNADTFGLAPLLQVVVLLVGLFTSVRLASNEVISRSLPVERSFPEILKLVSPMILFCLAYTILQMVLLVG